MVIVAVVPAVVEAMMVVISGLNIKPASTDKI
jgi:hypothetical protein